MTNKNKIDEGIDGIYQKKEHIEEGNSTAEIISTTDNQNKFSLKTAFHSLRRKPKKKEIIPKSNLPVKENLYDTLGQNRLNEKKGERPRIQTPAEEILAAMTSDPGLKDILEKVKTHAVYPTIIKASKYLDTNDKDGFERLKTSIQVVLENSMGNFFSGDRLAITLDCAFLLTKHKLWDQLIVNNEEQKTEGDYEIIEGDYETIKEKQVSDEGDYEIMDGKKAQEGDKQRSEVVCMHTQALNSNGNEKKEDRRNKEEEGYLNMEGSSRRFFNTKKDQPSESVEKVSSLKL